MATRFIPETHGMVTVAPERRLSSEGFASARADHSATPRSSDGSGNLTQAAHRLDRAKTEHHRCVWGERL